MEIVKGWVRRLKGWEYFGLCLITVLSLALHFSTIYQPAELILDELHYVPDARSILEEGETLRPEHPPLGKLFIVAGIYWFGDNPVGWRIPSILMGTISIVLFYFICRQLSMSQRASILATFLLALENMSFVQASVAMLDVFNVTFMLASFLLYLKGKYVFVGLAIALSALVKLNGALAGGVISLHWLYTNRKQVVNFLATMILAPIFFLLLMPLLDFATSRQFYSPIDRINTMLTLLGSVKFTTTTHQGLSRPWEWLYLPKIMDYWYQPRYVSAISFTIWALIIPTVVYLILKARKGSSVAIFALSWFICTYIFWIPVSIITDRASYVYYFYPVVGAICIGLGIGLSWLIYIWQTRESGRLKWFSLTSVCLFLTLHVVTFGILSPVFT